MTLLSCRSVLDLAEAAGGSDLARNEFRALKEAINPTLGPVRFLLNFQFAQHRVIASLIISSHVSLP